MGNGKTCQHYTERTSWYIALVLTRGLSFPLGSALVHKALADQLKCFTVNHVNMYLVPKSTIGSLATCLMTMYALSCWHNLLLCHVYFPPCPCPCTCTHGHIAYKQTMPWEHKVCKLLALLSYKTSCDSMSFRSTKYTSHTLGNTCVSTPAAILLIHH